MANARDSEIKAREGLVKQDWDSCRNNSTLLFHTTMIVKRLRIVGLSLLPLVCIQKMQIRLLAPLLVKRR